MFMRSEDIIIKGFIQIIDHLNKNKFTEDKKLIVYPMSRKTEEYNDNIFFNSGQLLAMFYIFNVNGISRGDIDYSDGKFFIKNLFKKKNINNNIDSGCISIAENIINASVYYKEFLPCWIEVNTNGECKAIEDGFVETYTDLLNEKILLIKMIEEYQNEIFFSDVINKLKILNYNDLIRQSRLIKLRLGYNYCNKIFNEKINDYNKDEFIDISCRIADELIEGSIIGVYDNEIEITWLQYLKNEIVTLTDKNIYVSLFLSYLSKNTNNKYYLQSAIQAIKPAIRSLNLEFYNKEEREYNYILNAMYYLNNMIYIGPLKSFIDSNDNIFKCYKDIDEKVIMETLLNEALKIINKIII